MEEILASSSMLTGLCFRRAIPAPGAEAASGLGRAFFYAGTRAILVTNWSVHSQSARELVTDLFKRQADDPELTRGEALRQAMMALMDGPGYVGADGKTEFAYAHPLFWAPTLSSATGVSAERAQVLPADLIEPGDLECESAR